MSAASHISSLPQEIIGLIFEKFRSPVHFSALARVNKLFYKISCSEEVFCHKDVFTCFGTLSNRVVRTLSFVQKQKLNLAIERSFTPFYKISKYSAAHLIESTIEKAYFDDRQLPKLVIDKHLIYPDFQGQIHIYNLKSVTENTEIVARAIGSSLPIKSFTPYRSNQPIKVAQCLAIRGKEPLLVTASLEFPTKIFVWDFNLLIQAKNNDVRPICILPESHCEATKKFFTDPHKLNHFIQTYKNFLAICYGDGVAIWDSSKSLSYNAAAILDFKNPFQIVFSPSHVMVVGEHQIAMWKLDLVEKALQDQPNVKISQKHCTNSLSLPNKIIKQAQLIHDKLIITYAKESLDVIKYKENLPSYAIGEVWNWVSGELLKILTSNKGDAYQNEIQAFDYKGGYLYTGSKHICCWDLNSKDPMPVASIMNRFGKNQIEAIYALGNSILFASKGTLEIQELISLKTLQVISGFELHAVNLDTFKILGRYLIAESDRPNPKGYGNRTISVFDLFKAMDLGGK